MSRRCGKCRDKNYSGGKSRRREKKRHVKNEDKCGCGNPCKIDRDECSSEDIICTPSPSIIVYELPKSDDCSADELNRIVKEFEDSGYQEAIIMIPAGTQINDKICFTTTRKISLCGDVCQPPVINGDLVSCGNKNYSGINFGGNGIYQLNDTCSKCPAPDNFNLIQVTCGRSFVSNSKSGLSFSNSFFDVKQSRTFTIRMTQGNLTFDNNHVQISPDNGSIAFAYYDAGDEHRITDSEFDVQDGGKCCDYGIHMLNSCTTVSSIGNRYSVGCQSNMTIFLGDANPAATVHASGDYAEERDSSGVMTLMRNIPSETLFAQSTYLISKLVVLESTKSRLGNNLDSRAPGLTKFTGVTFINPTPRNEPIITIVSDQPPDSLGNSYTLEINNSEMSPNLTVDAVQPSGDQPMNFISGQSTFQNRGSPALRFFSGTNSSIIQYQYGSITLDYLNADNTGGLLNLGAVSPVF